MAENAENLHPPIPAGWDGEPRLVVFYIPLEVPLGLPQGSTYTFERTESVDWLKGVPLHPVEGLTPRRNTLGRNFVSLQIWREKEKARLSDAPFTAAMNVAARVRGEKDRIREVSSDDGLVQEIVGLVFEAVTPLLKSEGGVKKAVSDAFDRCLEAINSLIRAYLLATKDLRVHLVSRQKLPPAIPWITRPPDAFDWGGMAMFWVNEGTSLRSPVEDLKHDDLEKLNLWLSNLLNGNPLVPFSEWRAIARRACFIEGDQATAVVACHTASEILLDAVLLLLAWEESTPRQDTRSWFDEGLAKRVRTYYAARLGGRWDTTDSKTVAGKWHSNVSKIRHRVVHAGYRPSEREAKDALVAADQLVDFVKDRLANKRTTYPKTALLVWGVPGFKRVGLYKGQIKRFVEEGMSEETDWMKSYRTWLKDE